VNGQIPSAAWSLLSPESFYLSPCFRYLGAALKLPSLKLPATFITIA